jgi:GTPase SAR1 family protein
LIGDSLTGKSAFLSKLISNEYKQSYEPTLGVETGVKSVENQNGTTTNITVWDFSGKLDFVEIRN